MSDVSVRPGRETHFLRRGVNYSNGNFNLLNNLKSAYIQGMTIKEIFNQTKNMGIGQKVKLVDMILTDLDKPDPLIEKAWIKEVSRRKTLMRTGRTRTRSYQQVMDKYL